MGIDAECKTLRNLCSFALGNQSRLQQQSGRCHGCVAPEPCAETTGDIRDETWLAQGYVHQEVIVEHVAGDPERTSRYLLRIVLSVQSPAFPPHQEVRHRCLRTLQDESPKSRYHLEGDSLAVIQFLASPWQLFFSWRFSPGPQQACNARFRTLWPQTGSSAKWPCEQSRLSGTWRNTFLEHSHKATVPSTTVLLHLWTPCMRLCLQTSCGDDALISCKRSRSALHPLQIPDIGTNSMSLYRPPGPGRLGPVGELTCRASTAVHCLLVDLDLSLQQH